MPVPVLPPIETSEAPSIDDVRAAERAIVEVVGGIHEGELYPGSIDSTNLSPSMVFSGSQVLQARARVCLAPARKSPLGDETSTPTDGDPVRTLMYAPVDVEIDTFTVWHNSATAVTGKIEVRVNGTAHGNLELPVAGLAQGEVLEIPYALSLRAGDFLDLFWDDGAQGYLKLITPAALPTFMRVEIHAWGVTAHVA